MTPAEATPTPADIAAAEKWLAAFDGLASRADNLAVAARRFAEHRRAENEACETLVIKEVGWVVELKAEAVRSGNSAANVDALHRALDHLDAVRSAIRARNQESPDAK